MTTLRTSKYIVTTPVTAPSHPIEPAFIKLMDDQRRQGITLDYKPFMIIEDSMVPGALHMGASWMWKLTGNKPCQTELAHTHPHDELLSFVGTDPEHPHDLCGKIELWLDGEQHILEQSFHMYVPAGMVHCPLIVHRIDRPIMNYVVISHGGYSRPWEDDYQNENVKVKKR